MIYTQVLQRGALGTQSPADALTFGQSPSGGYLVRADLEKFRALNSGTEENVDEVLAHADKPENANPSIRPRDENGFGR
jgi:hypothetical protein